MKYIDIPPATIMSVPRAGEETWYPVVLKTGYVLRVRHGSSPLLISRVHTFLTEKDPATKKYPEGQPRFESFDPQADHDKWSRRGMQLYYVAVVDPQLGEILFALRAVTEGIIVNPDMEPVPAGSKKRKFDSSQRRILIDYMFTLEQARKEGIAGLMVPQVLGLAQGGPCYIASLFTAYPYWKNKHRFGPCCRPGLNQLLNLFSDTVLLNQSWQEDEYYSREEEVIVEADCYQRMRQKRYRYGGRDLKEKLRRSIILPCR
jgi:hypothetical protein